ncbi:MAG: serine hydrolase domain-containing protein [Oscillospiraceae bacterium]|nr:serine hydrolase domain-containing protein [Oscillospiraceae bacterium]
MKKYIITAIAATAVIVMIPKLISGTLTYAGTDDSMDKAAASEPDTISCIGSVSKMFVTTAAMQLAGEGKIKLDAPVTDYIPEFHMADERYKDITVRMLMNHTSGLMGTTSKNGMLLDDRDISMHDGFISALNSQKLKADPGDYSTYCNDGFTLLEHVVERVSGESLTDYINDHICSPLNLKQTGTPWNTFDKKEQAEIFINENVRFATDYCMAIGSGGVISTAGELCTFGSAFFKGDNTLLSEKSKEEMSVNYSEDKYEDGFGLGWDSVEDPDYSQSGVKVVTKGGDVLNQHAQLIVAPDEKISVSVLSSGSNSTFDGLMGQALLDIALNEKGITVKHEKPEEKQTLSHVPESYLKYEDIYVSGSDISLVTFPDLRYMEIKCISKDKTEIKQYMYTKENTFVLMDGKIETGRAVQDQNQTVLRFQKRKGTDYICADICNDYGGIGNEKQSGYFLVRAGKNPVSDEVQKSWDERNGKKYYLCNEKYSSANYVDMVSLKIKTYDEAKGYVSSFKMADKNNAVVCASLPGFSGRDLNNIKLTTENGTEYLTLTNSMTELISEDAMPELTDSVCEVKLASQKAAWYKIGKSEVNKTITLNMPERAAVYVYDKYDKMTYSSYMTDYGNTVPLPSGGKIVFLGESGSSIEIS